MSDRRGKQLEIVLKLNRLTKQGRITWVSPSPLGLGTRYATRFGNRSYLLTDSPFASLGRAIPATIRSALKSGSGDLPSEGSIFSLFVQQDGEETEIWIPPMPATDDLASTVRFQIGKEDTQDLDEILRDLEEAETLLEG